MTAVRPERLDAVLAALADPTRRAILARLASGEASVTDLAAPFAMSPRQAFQNNDRFLDLFALLAQVSEHLQDVHAARIA